MHQTLLSTIGMSDVVDKFNLIDLIKAVLGNNTMAALYFAAIGRDKPGGCGYNASRVRARSTMEGR